ncbi:MAG: DNRLRE domain-containing protein [Phycisphaerales bacterium]|nr:DNRLRE domain-containing protein [Phycisphaerales bacterium]
MSTHTLINTAAIGLAVSCATTIALATEVTLSPSQDNTLIGPGSGENSNGSGDGFYAGQIGFFGGSEVIRRGLLQFDLSEIPATATITSVTLNVSVVKTPNDNEYEFSLHRCNASWGEGASDFPGGVGAPAEAGDATWVMRFHPDTPWSVEGGDFEADSSSTTMIGGRADYAFSGDGLIDDVQVWLDNPKLNHGWVMLGTEGTSLSARKFGSREYADQSKRPTLVVSYEEAGGTPGDFNGDGSVNGADLGLMLAVWGACPGCPEDLNDDGVVDGADMGLLLANWTG